MCSTATELCLLLSVQSVTVYMECVTKVHRVMDSVGVNLHTVEPNVTRVRSATTDSEFRSKFIIFDGMILNSAA